MIVYSRLIWIVSLSGVWFLKDHNGILVLAIMNLVIIAMAHKPIIIHLAIMFILSISLFISIFLLNLLFSPGESTINSSLNLGVWSAVKAIVLLSALPLVLSETFADDLLLSFVRIPIVRIEKKTLSISGPSAHIAYAICNLALPLLTIPRRFRAIWNAQILRGLLPPSHFARWILLMKRPWFVLWDLHTEPLLKKSISSIPLIYDALAMKGFHAREIPAWSKFNCEPLSIVFLFVSLLNLSVSLQLMSISW